MRRLKLFLEKRYELSREWVKLAERRLRQSTATLCFVYFVAWLFGFTWFLLTIPVLLSDLTYIGWICYASFVDDQTMHLLLNEASTILLVNLLFLGEGILFFVVGISVLALAYFKKPNCRYLAPEDTAHSYLRCAIHPQRSHCRGCRDYIPGYWPKPGYKLK